MYIFLISSLNENEPKNEFFFFSLFSFLENEKGVGSHGGGFHGIDYSVVTTFVTSRMSFE